MKTQVIKIGNSRAVIIPKSILEQSELGKIVDIELEDGELIIRSTNRPRKKWAKVFREMSEDKDDSLLN